MAEPVHFEKPDQLAPLAQETLRRLIRVWFEFERRLSQIDIVQMIEAERISLNSYRTLLLNLRAQVVEGSRWITRSASSFDRDFADVRSAIIGHALDEHRDYEIIEQDFTTAGGETGKIRSQPRNPGSDALHGFLMYRASLPNPVDMLGAMWIVEGLGNKMANEWAERIEQATARKDHTQFLRYHGANDQAHMDKLYALLERVCTDKHKSDRIIATATTVGRLYAMQLEEIRHED